MNGGSNEAPSALQWNAILLAAATMFVVPIALSAALTLYLGMGDSIPEKFTMIRLLPIQQAAVLLINVAVIAVLARTVNRPIISAVIAALISWALASVLLGWVGISSNLWSIWIDLVLAFLAVVIGLMAGRWLRP